MKRQREELKAIFDKAFVELGASQNADFDALELKYRSAERFYHGIAHIEACIGLWQQHIPAFARPYEAALTLFYHDVIYEPGRRDNEEQSAVYFRKDGVRAGLPSDVVERIVAHIVGTASHRSAGNDSRLINDIDLSILAAEASEYDRYVENIRREFAPVAANEEFKSGRMRFVESMLACDAIFVSQPFEKYEKKARRNLERELREYSP